jgi:hypothetical protein
MLSSAKSRPASRSNVVLDNYATHKPPKSLPSRKRGCWLGCRAIRAGRSTSPRSRPPGSTPWKTPSPRCPGSASAAVSSDRPPTCRPPSMLISEHNASPKPFVRTISADAILAKFDRCPVSSV